ncbi:MAG: N-glycosylase [Defluviitaleaceae bacterium]|nr:N-glycosylase [Defluviitaleaceae bacterium]
MINYEQKGDTVVVNGLNDFNIEQTLECGQCFRFFKVGELSYLIVALGRIINVSQAGNMITFSPMTVPDFENIWVRYFDLDKNYSEIKERLCKNDPIMQEAIAFADGIRILNQEPLECLVTFIISQNKQIPHIKQIVNNMSADYGEKIGEHFAFPTLDKLSSCNTEDFIRIKAGFRAKYIYDAAQKISSRFIDMEELTKMNTEKVKESLMMIKGVGPKVADCTMLFSFERREVFPVDVWVKRVMSHLYLGEQDVPLKEIHEFAKDKFGNYAGYAQQYLFHYARAKKIGSISSKFTPSLRK